MTTSFRMMAAMVLFRFEQELGSFVLEKSPNIDDRIDDLAGSIEVREKEKRRDISIGSTKDLIAETYIEDLFQLAFRLTKGTPEYDIFLGLQTLCLQLSLYEIRNAISHPNRPFLECYWYRLAAIVTDPMIQQLSLQRVLSTFDSALNGRIESPPDEWMLPPEWMVPNNLPSSNDYDITGLIGRPKESRDLLKLLCNQRLPFVAVVAPGGTGKTALAIDVLDKACKTPEFHNKFDAVIFISLKIEKLTTSGIEVLDAPSTVKEIENSLCSAIPAAFGFDERFYSFDVLKDEFDDKRLLLFIDNLETILRDSPDNFDAFQMQLPLKWRVLVTSRLTINSATCMAIEPLSDSHARHLTRIYATRRNASALLQDDVVERIIRPTRCNPLAIRLTVDAYVLGNPLEASIDVAAKDVVSFSYKNLLEVISLESTSVLECLFVSDPQTRSEIAENLAKTIDYVAKGIAELSRTSLIWRDSSQQYEAYSLYPAIRDLLLITPRSPGLRAEIQARLAKRRENSQDAASAQSGLSIVHQDYVECDLPHLVRGVFFEANKLLRKSTGSGNSEATLSMLERLRVLMSEYKDISAIHRYIARVYYSLGDRNTALAELEKCIAACPDDPRAWALKATIYYEVGDFPLSLAAYRRLKDLKFWGAEAVDKAFSRHCCREYLTSLLCTEQFEQILSETVDWQKDFDLKDIQGSFRARAWKRKVERIHDNDDKATGLNKAANILDDITKEFGHPKWIAKSYQEVIEEIAYAVVADGFQRVKQIDRLVRFVDDHITHVFKDEGNDLTKVLEIAGKLRRIDMKGNPFRSQEWGKFLESQGGQVYVKAEKNISLAESGYTLLKIYHIPYPKAPYVFAQDDQGRQYFAHFNDSAGVAWSEWASLTDGAQLAAKVNPGLCDDTKAVRAYSIVLI